MPSEPMNIQEQGFRSSLFGFDKNDVLAYLNALDNENRQHSAEQEEQIAQLQAQLDKMRSEQSAARACVEKLQSDLSAANQRAEAAEKSAAEVVARAKSVEERATANLSRNKENQQAVVEWQFRCRDLQKQIDRFIGNFLNRFINHIRKYRVIRQLDQKHIQFPGNRNDLLRNRLNKPSWLNRKSCDISFCKLAKQLDKFFQIIFKRK